MPVLETSGDLPPGIQRCLQTKDAIFPQTITYTTAFHIATFTIGEVDDSAWQKRSHQSYHSAGATNLQIHEVTPICRTESSLPIAPSSEDVKVVMALLHASVARQLRKDQCIRRHSLQNTDGNGSGHCRNGLLVEQQIHRTAIVTDSQSILRKIDRGMFCRE